MLGQTPARPYNAMVNTTQSTMRPKKKTTRKAAAKEVPDSMVNRAYCDLREKAITYRFLPGERLNEAILAKELGVSRTPLREALNRLAAEGFLTFSPNLGFFRKALEVKEIFDLYEFRQQLEMAAVKLAVERATDEQLQKLEEFVHVSAEEVPTRTADEMVALDEFFHTQLAKLTGNVEMQNSLENINARIQYVRWMDMNGRREETQFQHKEIVRKMRERDAKACVQLMSEHISHRLDQIIDKVERCYGRMYVTARRDNRSS
jgi:DNA-binding GntR family transcriptional regulator